METIDLTTLLVIFLVAIGTFGLRVSGLLFSNKLIGHNKAKLFLEYLPATLLLSLVMPGIIKEGVVGIVATILIAICIYKTRSILLSLVVAVVFVALSRNLII